MTKFIKRKDDNDAQNYARRSIPVSGLQSEARGRKRYFLNSQFYEPRARYLGNLLSRPMPSHDAGTQLYSLSTIFVET
jgi:hypothetical protein